MPFVLSILSAVVVLSPLPPAPPRPAVHAVRSVVQDSAAKAAKTQKPSAKAAAGRKWGPPPDALPRGAKFAVVSGDPSKPGPFVIALSMPNGYRVAPHWHPTDETVHVERGTLMYGMGDKWDAASMKRLAPGQEHVMAANERHYVRARGRTVLNVSGTGPFVLTYVNAADDPRQKKAME